MNNKLLRAHCRRLVTARAKEKKLTWKQAASLFKELYAKAKIRLNQ